ncbi:choice-of-anchor D domain-containing protein [bacterium]|nr:choice-of-anchor D domain-containing protein [bacterium]MBU1637407.1 choice-of-anchor D domain-containing protein [bacterium]
MRLKLTVSFVLLASILLASSAFADNFIKGQPLDPAAKNAPATTLRAADHHSSGTLDEVLASADFNTPTFPPTNWTRTIQNSAYTWRHTTATFYEGTGAMDCEYDPALSPQDEWLISPVIDMSSTAASYQVSFWWMMSYYWGVTPNDNYDIELKVSTDGGATWVATALWSEAEQGVFENWEWYNTSVNVSQYAGNANVKFGFRYVGVDGAQAAFDLIAIESIAPGGTLTGTVTDAATSAPISGVTVTVAGEGSSGTTNATGVYTLNDVTPGTYTVNFTNPVYEPASATGVVITLGQTTTQNMTMNALPIIQNDDCDDPYVLSGEGVFPFSTASATIDASIAELPAECDEGAGLDFAADIWVSWIAPGTGMATFSTCNDATYDTRLACYTTGDATCAPCPTTNEFFHACNDDGDGCAGYTSILDFEVSSGACYLVRVGGWGTATGTGNLTVTLEGAPLPILTVDPTSLDFQGVEVGTTDDLTFTIGNTGAANLLVTSITAPAGYTVTPTATAVTPGSTRLITVTFAPTAAQVYSGDISIVSNDENSPTAVPVTGEGITDVDAAPGLVTEYYVATSYPNPFNPETTISFAIPKAEQVSVVVFNSIGQEVAVLNNGRLDAGAHSFTFSGADLPSGLYFTRIESDGFSQTLKNVLMK